MSSKNQILANFYVISMIAAVILLNSIFPPFFLLFNNNIRKRGHCFFAFFYFLHQVWQVFCVLCDCVSFYSCAVFGFQFSIVFFLITKRSIVSFNFNEKTWFALYLTPLLLLSKVQFRYLYRIFGMKSIV